MLDLFIRKGWFTGSQNKKTKEAYERYLKVTQAFKDAMSALPGKDTRGREISEQAAGRMTKKNAGGFDGAGQDLALLMALLRRGWMRDSFCESSMVAGLYEQTYPAELHDQELAGLQRSAEAT
ncbi:hypothetical protein, partial [Sedimentitalea todarodis]